MTWDGARPVAADLYYDPVVDEHVGHGPMGLIAPAWYFAPQRRELARAGWDMAAAASGVPGTGPVQGLDNPALATMLLQLAGEFADPATKARLWAEAEAFIEPSWDLERGEFTLGFRLGELHPRGQWNARTMAGWVCTEGAWAGIFNAPNLAKFEQPTVSDVDFPRVALSEARWDGNTLRLAAHPQNAAARGAATRVRVTGLPAGSWEAVDAAGSATPLVVADGEASVGLVADNRLTIVRRR